MSSLHEENQLVEVFQTDATINGDNGRGGV